MKVVLIVSSLILLLAAVHHAAAFWNFSNCIVRCSGWRNLTTCPASRLLLAYRAMLRANCRNCDKFFHCTGNYIAVHGCGRNQSKNRQIAERISDCRERCQGGGGIDSAEDQEANRFGRNGGNCERRYLCAYGCYYKPANRSCRRSNC